MNRSYIPLSPFSVFTDPARYSNRRIVLLSAILFYMQGTVDVCHILPKKEKPHAL